MVKTLIRLVSGCIPFRPLRRRVRERLMFLANCPGLTVGLSNCTLVDAVLYFEKIKALLLLLAPWKAEGVELVRIGGEGDGGYVMADPGGGGLALSLGVSVNSPWDLEMAKRGFIVHQYDGTIESPPDTHPNMHFHKNNIDESDEPGTGTVTLGEVLREHAAHTYDNVILQIDIEGSEWDLFEKAGDETLALFSQIIAEFHDLSPDREGFDRYLAILRKLDRTHVPIHLHCNNASYLKRIEEGNLGIPPVYEVSYIRRDGRGLVRSEDSYPTSLDSRNVLDSFDFSLGAPGRLVK